MKNRKVLYSIFVIAALLCLGVGYAAVSKTLSITGKAVTATTDKLQEQIDVYFTGYEDTTSNTYNSRIAATSDTDYASKPKTVNFTVTGFEYLGDTAEVTCTVKNDSPWMMYVGFNVINNGGLDAPTDNNFTTYFQFNTYGSLKINSGEAKTFTFTIKLIKVPSTQITGDFSVTTEVEFA